MKFYVETKAGNGKHYKSRKAAWDACVEANQKNEEVYMSSYTGDELVYHCYSGDKAVKTAWRD